MNWLTINKLNTAVFRILLPFLMVLLLPLSANSAAPETSLFQIEKSKLSNQERRVIYTAGLSRLPPPFSDPLSAPRDYSFSAKDSAVYFSAELPGGRGGKDIYVSYWNGEQWEAPQNMGPGINTEHNESHPFKTASGKLLFSSNRPGGLGGLDIYYALSSASGWLPPVWLDTPLNSESDDYALVSLNDLKDGYFTSDRKSRNTVYSFQRNTDIFSYCKQQKEPKYCYTFSDSRIMPPDSISPIYQWEFGSDTILTGKEVSYCFGKAGQYELILRVIDPTTGDTINNPIHYPVTIQDVEQPYILLTGNTSINGELIIDANHSHLPGINIIDYFWDFGDGSSTQGLSARHRYSLSGEYTVKLGIVGTNANNERVFHCVYKKITITNE